MAQELAKIKKLEAAKVLNQKEWQGRKDTVLKSIQEASELRANQQIEKDVFEVMANQEQKSLQRRLETLKQHVREEANRELELQERYRVARF